MPTFNETHRGYLNLWNKADIRQEWLDRAQYAVDRIRANEGRYRYVANDTGVPWQMIGVLHSLESGRNFATHLHNGDPLMDRTTHVPAGYPKANPKNGEYYTWEESAVDALKLHKLHEIAANNWTIERILYETERFNGFGYFKRGVNSPYLWSGTTLYSKGKYVADGKYSSEAVSKQVGAVPLLKLLLKETMDDHIKVPETSNKEDSMSLLPLFIKVAPLIIGAIVDNTETKPVAEKIIREKIGATSEDDVLTKVGELATDQVVKTLQEAEKLFTDIVQPPEAETSVPVALKENTAPELTVFDNIFGEKLAGWKTYIAIGIAVLVNGAAALGVAPDLLTPSTVAAIDTVLGGFGGAALISKIERFFKNK